MPPTLPDAARDAILAWYAERGRPLAFRRTRDPYAILVSEAMAQQTQAARAAAYWERFMVTFPTVEALAAASPADVLRAWAGLGYDRRAVALWRAARVIVDEHGGQVPSSIDELEALPGVGPYTARAVAALAFGVPVGAVDVNVRRVLGRILGGVAGLTSGELQAAADAAVPRDDPGGWTHAVMDVGATICKPRRPRCEACPAAAWCRYASEAEAEAEVAADAPPSTVAGGRSARRSSVAFTATNRWLRGRILDRLRAAPDGTWVAMDAAIGTHPPDAVRAAVRGLAADGLVELRSDLPDAPGAVARLATG
jgi:A/G-specific adenine glycosylase